MPIQDQQEGRLGRGVKALERFTGGDMHGIHYAVSISIASAILWIFVHELAKSNPVWAISSMVATSDPLMKTAILTFRARIINTLVGCAVGLLFIAVGGTRVITLPLAMAVTVLLSSYVVRIQTMWRQAPIAAAFVIAAGLEHHKRLGGLQAGAGRVSEVLFGCVVGLAVAWFVSVVWPLPEPVAASPAGK
ncbi:MAG: FUSC family protein [Candidatus Korobacteraceae bacterium]